MNKEELYNIDIFKKRIKNLLKERSEPEIVLKIKDNKYMIIPLGDRISIQCLGKTQELYYTDIESLFSEKLFDGIVLNDDWKYVKNIEFY